MNLPRLIALVATAALLSLSSAQAGVETDAIDMTGTWDGKISCKGIDQTGAPLKEDVEGSLLISMTANSFYGIFVEGGSNTRGGDLDPELCGFTVQQSGKAGKGLATLEEGPEYFREQSISLNLKVFDEKPNGLSGIAKGISVWSPDGGGDSATCTWKFKRFSQDDPGVVQSGC